MRATRRCRTAPEVHRRGPTLANDATDYTLAKIYSNACFGGVARFIGVYTNAVSSVAETVVQQRHNQMIRLDASITDDALMDQSDQNHHPSLLGQLALFAAAAVVLLVFVWTYLR
jgi:hypothetical protein